MCIFILYFFIHFFVFFFFSILLGESCIALVTMKALKSGTEITYNYQYSEDGLDNISAKMKRQKCLCQATNCSGKN